MNEIRCPVCGNPLRLSPAKSRKAKKPKVFLMLACTVDGRHFRGFINDKELVGRVIEKAGALSQSGGRVDAIGKGNADPTATLPNMDKVGNPDNGADGE